MKKIVGWFEEAAAADHGLAELVGAGFAPGDVEARAEPGKGRVVVVQCEDARAAAAMRCLAAGGARRVALETLAAGETNGPA
jgi:hypothetical protein